VLPEEVSSGEHLQDPSAEQARENADGEQEVGSAGDPALTIKGDTTAWDDQMDMRMVGERRAPGVENGEDADAGAEMFGICIGVFP
jgi:hypothetical protein